jgi:hypothetical protein
MGEIVMITVKLTEKRRFRPGQRRLAVPYLGGVLPSYLGGECLRMLLERYLATRSLGPGLVCGAEPVPC